MRTRKRTDVGIKVVVVGLDLIILSHSLVYLHSRLRSPVSVLGALLLAKLELPKLTINSKIPALTRVKHLLLAQRSFRP